MPTPISPAIPPTIPQSLTGPADGEVANALSVNSTFQDIENGIESFRQLTYGGGLRRRVTCTSNTSMTVQPLGAIVTKDAGVWSVISHVTPSIISPTAITGGLVASTRYWVYAYNNGGSVGFMATTTGPDAGLRYANGDESKQFVSTFYVNASSTVVTYTQNDAIYNYNALPAILTAATGSGPILLTDLVPAQASLVKLTCYGVIPTASSGEIRINIPGNPDGGYNLAGTQTGTPALASTGTFESPTVSGITYTVTAVTGAPRIEFLRISGFVL